MYIPLKSLKSVSNGVSLDTQKDEHKLQVTYIVADISKENEVRYEYGYKNLVTSQVFNGNTGTHFGRYNYEKVS